jgi:hypothetical protein
MASDQPKGSPKGSPAAKTTDCPGAHGQCVDGMSTCKKDSGAKKDRTECAVDAKGATKDSCLQDHSRAKQYIKCDKNYDPMTAWDSTRAECYAYCKKNDKMMEYVLIAAAAGGVILLLIIIFAMMHKS